MVVNLGEKKKKVKWVALKNCRVVASSFLEPGGSRITLKYPDLAVLMRVGVEYPDTPVLWFRFVFEWPEAGGY
jgi:hypothetical protein